MSTQRLVDSCFWDDSYIVTLDPCEKLLFLYLLTNPLTNIAGVYEISIKRIAFDSGFEQDTVRRVLGRFERDGRCVYRDGWVAMRNWLKHQRVNPNVMKGIERVLETVPEELAGYVQGKPIESLPKDSLLNLTQPNLTQPIGRRPSPTAPVSKRDAHFTEFGDLITQRGGKWAAGGKEAVSLDRLIAWAKAEHSDSWLSFLHDFLDGAWALRRGEVRGLRERDVDYWKAQPYTPSRLLSNAAAIVAVLEHAADKQTVPVELRDIVGRPV